MGPKITLIHITDFWETLRPGDIINNHTILDINHELDEILLSPENSKECVLINKECKNLLDPEEKQVFNTTLMRFINCDDLFKLREELMDIFENRAKHLTLKLTLMFDIGNEETSIVSCYGEQLSTYIDLYDEESLHVFSRVGLFSNGIRDNLHGYLISAKDIDKLLCIMVSEADYYERERIRGENTKGLNYQSNMA